MVQYFPYLLLLMVAIMLLIMLANRLKVAYPILLVLGGLAISLIPNVPTITLNPDLVLIIQAIAKPISDPATTTQRKFNAISVHTS